MGCGARSGVGCVAGCVVGCCGAHCGVGCGAGCAVDCAAARCGAGCTAGCVVGYPAGFGAGCGESCGGGSGLGSGVGRGTGCSVSWRGIAGCGVDSGRCGAENCGGGGGGGACSVAPLPGGSHTRADCGSCFGLQQRNNVVVEAAEVASEPPVPGVCPPRPVQLPER